MSATKKPTNRVASTKLAPPVLSPEEQILLKSFRTMDAQAREFIGKLAATQAARWPLHKLPALRLVSGSAS